MSSNPDDSLQDWIALSLVTGVGSRTAAALIDRFGSATACFRASTPALEMAGLKRESIEAMKSAEVQRRAELELGELHALGAAILTLQSDDYPALLRETYDPPIILYAMGHLTRGLSQPVIAMVGSRRCSTYGRNVAEKLARDLASRGVTIVSGLARGIDCAAHRGAVEGRGLTIGVMGTGLDSIYPKENRKLADRIMQQGALLTEFPLRTPPLSQNFPFRNRVISGIGLGVLVVEGAERSGSLITARLAYEQGRDVFAVPGNVTSGKSFGPNYLIKDGAKLVQNWHDVVEEFPLDQKTAILSAERGDGAARQPTDQLKFDQVALTESERKVLKLLSVDDSMHIDQLIVRSGMSYGDLTVALLNLEMQDRIRQLPGKAFVRKL